VLSALVVNLWQKIPAAIWPIVKPGPHFAVERCEVLVRSRDLSLYPREGTLVNLHDVILDGPSE
jgi:hypothetical protein